MTEIKPDLCPFCRVSLDALPSGQGKLRWAHPGFSTCFLHGIEVTDVRLWNSRRPAAGAEPEVAAEEALSVAREIVAAYAAQFGANAPPRPDDDRELVVARALLSVPRSVKDEGRDT